MLFPHLPSSARNLGAQTRGFSPCSIVARLRGLSTGGAVLGALAALALCLALGGCANDGQNSEAAGETAEEAAFEEVADAQQEDAADTSSSNGRSNDEGEDAAEEESEDAEQARASATDPETLRAALDIREDYRESFVHGEKAPRYQRYIVLHDTEGSDDAESVIDWWDSNGNRIAAHFVINKDGSIWQCAPLDAIVHHAGFGDAGHNVKFGVNDESRDDKAGTTSIGDDYPDYGMNSYSVGIEMVHTGGEGDYPEAQLEALDGLIAYIDAYYGFESQIIDHKMWRTSNSDTSAEFADYLKSYQAARTHE